MNQLCQSGLVDLTVLHVKVLCQDDSIISNGIANGGEQQQQQTPVGDVVFQVIKGGH